MPDLKITQLSADTNPTNVDLITTVKSPFGAGSNRKVTLADLPKGTGLIGGAPGTAKTYFVATTGSNSNSGETALLPFLTIQYAIERDRLQQALRKAHSELEIKVEDRTKDLSEMIDLLKKEITDRREAEEQLQEATEIKSRFVSMVSHELRTPLTALKEGIRLMTQEKTGKLNDEQKEFLDLFASKN